ncbi:MAG TPA: SPFH domain-containing protein [Bacteroidia bacterium]|nr:SPFH domain-containing protein [Bacteroidia bacterium]
MKTEKLVTPSSGYVWLFLLLASAGLIIYAGIATAMYGLIALSIIPLIMLAGLIVIDPNESRVLILFGEYRGTVKENGFYFVNPFFVKKKITLRARNIDSTPIKVNDKLGNPIKIGVVLVWKVNDTFKAAFEVDNYEHFVGIQSEAAIRKLAGHYPYDNFDDEEAEISLRAGGEEVNHQLEMELRERLAIAGIEVMEARISHLAYAEEIAGAMLQRQQATAIVAARAKIVEGAVGMVEMALAKLSEQQLVHLDEDKKATMISNLMVVLCGDRAASPVINAGTLHS